MKKILVCVAMMSLAFGSVSCTSDLNSSSTDDRTSSDPMYDGGYTSGSRVVGGFSFYSFDEFQYFYSIFKQYNSERYWLPVSDDQFEFCYSFESEGMYLGDVIDKNYDVDFDFQHMMVHIDDDDFCFEMEMNDLQRKHFDDGSGFYVNLSADDLSYSIEETTDDETSFYILSKETSIGVGTYISYTSDEDIIAEKLDAILELFEEGADYVF